MSDATSACSINDENGIKIYEAHRSILPVQQDLLALVCALKSKPEALGSKAEPVEPPEPLVYVVDDDISVRESLGNLMRSVGLQAEVFKSASEFLQYRRPDRPSCLVLDVRLPNMSGLDLQDELAETGDQTPIIFITGHGDVPMSVRAMKAGAVEFLQKPFREQDLLDAIHLALAKSRPKVPRDATASAAHPSERDRETASPGVASGPAITPLSAPETGVRQSLARNLQIGRAIFKLSQADLAGRCGLHRSHVSALEREELSVGVDTIDSIASAFGISPHILLMPTAEAQSRLLETLNSVETAATRKSPR